MFDSVEYFDYFAKKYKEILNSKELKFTDFVSIDSIIKIKGLPQSSGVYMIFEKSKPIYVGLTGKLQKRIHDLFYYNPNPKRKTHWNHILSSKLMLPDKVNRFKSIDQLREFYFTKCTFKYIELKNVREARVLEDLLILILGPIYNE